MAERKGPGFEKEVEDLLALKGYSVTRNHLINGTQIDLIAKREDVLDNLAFVVECTDRKEPVGVDLLKQKAAVLLTLGGQQSLFRLLMVTRSGYTAEAKAFAAADPRIAVLTLTELESQLIDFRPYANWYTSNFEKSLGMFREGSLHGDYVELAGTDETGQLLPSLAVATTAWLQDRTNNILFLLGEYGSGKTSFCRQFVYRLLKDKYTNASQQLVPILINLRDYRTASNMKQVITDTLVNQYGVSLPSFLAFERICGLGSALLVLDGFDEMAGRSDRQALLECFQQIYLLAALNTKILLILSLEFLSKYLRHRCVVQALLY